MKYLLCTLSAVAVSACLPSSTHAVTLTNGLDSGTLGYFRIDLDPGGESETGYVTATRSSNGELTTDEIVYDYHTYIQTGDTVIQLGVSGSGGVSEVDGGGALSTGSFTGSGGNTIEWEAYSTMLQGEVTMQTRYTFRAVTGTLGDLILHQYLDEDVNNSAGDDFLVRTGSADARNLQLFTLDSTDRYGISHSGAFSSAQGLVNAQFLGWAADEYSELRERIRSGDVVVDRNGNLDTESLPPFVDEQFGQVYGPEDVTSTLTWKVEPAASTAVIITSLGGVPDASSINLSGSLTVTYTKGTESMLEGYWENVRLYDYTAGEWMVWEDRWHEPGAAYEFTNLRSGANYWFGSWNYASAQWETSTVLMVVDLLGD